ncbi:MAG: hypothetical protein OXG71_06955 [Rhodospirillales bacterium]|nr:hypothetical protein [Rhodospirillales bacterium]
MHWLHALKSCRLGRRRRGAGLADMTLAMVVMVVVIDGAVRFGTGQIERHAVALTAGQLSRLADDVEAWAAAEYTTLQPQVDAYAHDTEERSWTALIAAGDISEDSVPATALRQSVRVFLHAPIAGNLYVVLLTDSPGDGIVSHVPRPNGGARLVGRVDAHLATELRGWDFSYDLSDIIAETGHDFRGELGAIRQVSDQVHVSPYLHRVAVPGRPELNRLEAPLDMNGNDIVDAGRIEAVDVAVGGALTVRGELSVDSATVTNELSVLGTLSAASANVAALTAPSIEANALTTPSVSAETATVETLTVATEADITTLAVGAGLSVGSLVLEDVSLDHLTLSGGLTADSIITETLATTSCTGC